MDPEEALNLAMPLLCWPTTKVVTKMAALDHDSDADNSAGMKATVGGGGCGGPNGNGNGKGGEGGGQPGGEGGGTPCEAQPLRQQRCLDKALLAFFWLVRLILVL